MIGIGMMRTSRQISGNTIIEGCPASGYCPTDRAAGPFYQLRRPWESYSADLLLAQLSLYNAHDIILGVDQG